jgi:radical SAM superfamily enzyme YgiQ (UPF0313 family)
MKKKIYLINPKEADIGYFRWPEEPGKPSKFVYVADLATTTVARLMEPYFDVEICEASISEVNFDTDADFIGITGKITQWGHMRELANEFRKRGKIVIFGGPYVSLSFDRARPYCDILVIGEIEEIADEMFAEIASGNWKPEYKGTQPDLAISPIPRWDIYPNRSALMGTIQISRGCPFQCEFCDVIEYLGRKQRHKPVDNILKELDELYKFGYREAFIADDNLTVYRKKAKEILQAVGDWNRKQLDGNMFFRTQVSIDIARDEEMMDIATYSGLYAVFIGIETPNLESLKETRKFQNLRIDLVEEVQSVFRHGLSVYGGMIVGFDNDTPDIFEAQFEFITASQVPYVTYGLLNAPDQTPLHERLQKDNRLIEFDEENIMAGGNAYETNILFKNISTEEAQIGSKWLMNNIYSPFNFGERMCNFIELLGESKMPVQSQNRSTLLTVEKELYKFIRKLKLIGEEEKLMYERVLKVMNKHPHSIRHVMAYLALYASVRYSMNVKNTWDQSLVGKSVFDTSFI